MHTGERMRLFRNLMGWTQDYAGILLGIPQRKYGRIEASRRPQRTQHIIKQYALLVGVKADYLISGIPPAIAKGWLYYELPPKRLQGTDLPLQKLRNRTEVRQVIGDLFPQFLWEHSVQSYGIGEVSSQDAYFVYQIAPHAFLTIRALDEFVEALFEVANKLRLDLEKRIQVPPHTTDSPDSKIIANLFKELGIPLWVDFLETFDKIVDRVKSQDKAEKAKALHELCLKIMDLGIDPADVFEELKRIQRERQKK